MKRLASIALVLLLGASARSTMAHDQHSMPGMKSGARSAARSLTGEVVDMGCWLGHAARGEKHVSCATKCLNQGMPMGLLTSNGMLYLVTLDHDDADPYNQMKTMAGKNVTVTGEILTRSGMRAIEASKVRLASR